MQVSWILLYLGIVLLLPSSYEAAKPVPCNCNCNGVPIRTLCAYDNNIKDRDTFPSRCHLECYNCTMDKHYVVISEGDCAPTTTRPTRPTIRQHGRGLRSLRFLKY